MDELSTKSHPKFIKAINTKKEKIVIMSADYQGCSAQNIHQCKARESRLHLVVSTCPYVCPFKAITSTLKFQALLLHGLCQCVCNHGACADNLATRLGRSAFNLYAAELFRGGVLAMLLKIGAGKGLKIFLYFNSFFPDHHCTVSR